MIMKQMYKDLLWKYGFLMLLMLMDKLKQEEKYEDCACIVDILKEHYKAFGLNYPLEYCDEAVEIWKNNLKELGISWDPDHRIMIYEMMIWQDYSIYNSQIDI